jgi:tetratricopeptide (TPR) repeat protein
MELSINTHMLVADMHRNVLAGQEDTDCRHQSVSTTFSIRRERNTDRLLDSSKVSSCEHQGSTISHRHSVSLGEFPPPVPGACFGRDELIGKLVGFAESLESIALIGAGGIGKTSIALTVLHHNRIKARFGDNRRFIRCDHFPASRLHFLARLSKVIGAGVENPEDLVSLRPFLSSREIFIVIDNAESVLDPQGTDSKEIYGVVDELCRFETVCLYITSRIATVPRHCKRPEIPTLSMEAACNIFYSIHDHGGRSDIIDNLLQRLDFHALSITLLATTASHNMWDYDELAKEWDIHRAQVLQTEYNESLAATIELSLTSPTFQKLGPDARDLLEVVAFFPRGVDERNLDWLFPTIPDRKHIFTKFRVLSLTHRTNNFITMLAPIRDYLRPKNPNSSPLLRATKDHYFTRLEVSVNPGSPGFEDAQWIKLEDANVEHLLDVFMSIDTDADDICIACIRFMGHLYWHKARQTLLRPKIEALPDDHWLKPACLFHLSRLFESVGNPTEQKRLLSHALRLERQQGSTNQVASTLRWLCRANQLLGLYEEGIQQAKEALGICEQHGDTVEQAHCLVELAYSLRPNNQLDAAEEAASRAIKLLPKEGQEFLVCKSHRALGLIYHSKGESEKAIHHFKEALGIASASNWHDQLFRIHLSLAALFRDEDKFGDAQAHTEQAMSQAGDGSHEQGCAIEMQARIWYRQSRLEEAKSEVFRAMEIYKELGAAEDIENCRELLLEIEQAMKI